MECLLGHLDRSLTRLSAVTERAPPAGYPASRVEFLAVHVNVKSFFIETAELARLVERFSELAREFGLALYDAMATIYRGHVTSCRGDPETGSALLNAGMGAYAATGAAIWSGYHRALLAEAYQRLGQLCEARQILSEAQDWAERSGERWYDAELARRLGELDRQEGSLSAAERRFKQALAISRRQHARLWELHAATSLARLWHEQRRSAEARAVLAPVYDCFREGLHTASLRRAKALLDELTPNAVDPDSPGTPPGPRACFGDTVASPPTSSTWSGTTARAPRSHPSSTRSRSPGRPGFTTTATSSSVCGDG